MKFIHVLALKCCMWDRKNEVRKEDRDMDRNRDGERKRQRLDSGKIEG